MVRVWVIASANQLAHIASHLAYVSIVGVDCEGEKLSRTGRLCLIQIAAGDDVFLVDVVAVGCAAITRYLKQFFESKSILKIMHDCRKDSDALLHQCNIQLQNVFDCQCGFAVVQRQNWESNSKYSPKNPFIEPLPISFAKLLQIYCGITFQGKQDMKVIINTDPSFWARRPLISTMIDYATTDVVYLISIYRMMWVQMMNEYRSMAMERSLGYCEFYRNRPKDLGEDTALISNSYRRPNFKQFVDVTSAKVILRENVTTAIADTNDNDSILVQ